MHWVDIKHFDETDGEHVQALKERCLRGGQTVYTFSKKLEQTPSHITASAEAFASNMSIDARFSEDLFHLEVPGGSEDWWKWFQQMEAWWLEGYHQARSNDRETGT